MGRDRTLGVVNLNLQDFIDSELAERLNPDRPAESDWQLYAFDFTNIDLKRLKHAAEQLGHPSLQLLLALLC